MDGSEACGTHVAHSQQGIINSRCSGVIKLSQHLTSEANLPRETVNSCCLPGCHNRHVLCRKKCWPRPHIDHIDPWASSAPPTRPEAAKAADRASLLKGPPCVDRNAETENFTTSGHKQRIYKLLEEMRHSNNEAARVGSIV